MVKDFTAVGYLAVGVLVLALFVGAVVGLVKLSQNLNNKGTAMLQKGTAQLMEFEYTQYDEKIITGSEVIALIKQYWVADNTIAILVCTRDGMNAMYDYSGYVHDIRGELTGFPTVDAKNVALNGNIDATVKKICIADASTLATTFECFDQNIGYKESNSRGAGYINRTSGMFKGSLQYDSNNTCRCLTFVQQ